MDALWNQMENETDLSDCSRTLSSAEKYKAQQQASEQESRRFTGSYLLKRSSTDPDPLREGSWQSEHQKHLQQLQAMREEERRLEDSLYSTSSAYGGPPSRRSTCEQDSSAEEDEGAVPSTGANAMEEKYCGMLRDQQRKSVIGAYRESHYTGEKAQNDKDRKMKERVDRIEAELQRLAVLGVNETRPSVHASAGRGGGPADGV